MLDLCSIVVGRRVVFKWEPRHRLQSCPVTFVFRCRPSRGGGRRACDVEWPLFVWTLLPDISTPVLSPKLSKMRTTQSSFQSKVIRILIDSDGSTLSSQFLTLALEPPRTKR